MAKSGGRLVSLDIFRGLTIAFMIIVNFPGSWQYIYPPLRHASWYGCTPTDLVFPFFLLIVGLSTYYSLKKYGSEINWNSFFRIIRRMVTIFAVGLFLNLFPYFGRDYSTLRIMGVLQEVALAYGIGALICLAVRQEYLWSLIFPINKPLWTSSYILYSAGLAMGVLAVIYMIANVLKFQEWGTFFLVFGTNSLFVYFLAGIWTKMMLFIKIPSGGEKISIYGWFYLNVCVPVAGNLNVSLMFAKIQMLFIWAVALVLYRKKIMIRL